MASRAQTRFEERARSASDRLFGVTVTFRQDGKTTDSSFTATWEKPKSIVAAEKNATLKTAVYTRVWRLPAASLVCGGRVIEPANGGVIKETATGHKFQIVSGNDIPKPELLAGNYQWLVYTTRISDG